MLKYFIGWLSYLFHPGVSLFSLVDKFSIIDKNARLFYNTKCFESTIDKYSYVAPGTELTKVKIGKFCSIGRECLIGLPFHPVHNISTSPIFISNSNVFKLKMVKKEVFEEYKNVVIGNDVWIGSKVIVQGGVKIGNGAIIGAGAIVTKDIPDYAIAVGVPAKVIKYRFESDMIEKLNNICWWDNEVSFLINSIDFFLNPELYPEDLIKLKSKK